jgi:hypothetical protein
LQQEPLTTQMNLIEKIYNILVFQKKVWPTRTLIEFDLWNHLLPYVLPSAEDVVKIKIF